MDLVLEETNHWMPKTRTNASTILVLKAMEVPNIVDNLVVEGVDEEGLVETIPLLGITIEKKEHSGKVANRHPLILSHEIE